MPAPSTKQPDAYNLSRFLDAQQRVYIGVLEELKAGRKKTHWMWFIFPQMDGLGRSPTAQRFSIRSIEEAKAYLAHPVLGSRLAECTSLVLAINGKSAREIFGDPDWMKFRSSMTLFANAEGGESVFSRALEQYFSGDADEATLRLLARHQQRDKN